MATLCNLTSGISVPCFTQAGINSCGVFIGPYDCGNPNGMIISTTASGQITGFSGATVSFWQISQNQELASLTSNPDTSQLTTNGTFYSVNTLEFTVFGYSQTLQNQINILASGRWRALILGNDKNWYMLGVTAPLMMTSGTGGINKMLNDLNGMVITMESHESQGLVQVTATAAQSLLQYN
jgi:hypothetical protein